MKRAATDFEELRLATEAAPRRPKVFMLTIGNLAMRLARAQFSTNFFGCAGYEIIDNLGFNTVEEGVDAALAKEADVVVLCSSDDEYAILAPEAYKYLNGLPNLSLPAIPHAPTSSRLPASMTSFMCAAMCSTHSVISTTVFSINKNRCLFAWPKDYETRF